MKGILILAHGSREKATEETLAKVIAYLLELVPGTVIQSAYLQFSENNLEAGLDSLKAQGISDITVVPYFLFEGVHIREDIPAEIVAYLRENSGITVKLGKTLGADRRLAEILADRLREAL